MVEKLPDMNVKHIIFITRPALAVMDAIAKLVHADDRRAKGSAASAGGRGAAAGRGGGPSVTGTKEYHLYFVPRVSQLCEKHLQDRGVFGSFATIGAFACEIYPVDSDLLSMELPNVYKYIINENSFGVLIILFLVPESCTSKVIQPVCTLRPLRCRRSNVCMVESRRSTAKVNTPIRCGT